MISPPSTLDGGIKFSTISNAGLNLNKIISGVGGVSSGAFHTVDPFNK